ncbi:DEAD/DEAH box helicase family protein [Aliarcobacter butzleri]|uniref:DEAD/DEAH box helicase family protein n=1 Tax=Aliarcobacter butzleri TaxID=28197 RepID=UPI00126A6148|nr:DEAD/DEAH box helicase family protein [Aliarcobacter butzleri]
MSNYTPYINQELAINNVLNGEKGLNKKDRTQLIMCCGTGKSLVSMWVHQNFVSNLNENITLLFYPSLFLVNQTYNTYQENSILKFNPLVVCSDKAIGDNESDDVFELDISEVKYPVTTNIEDIKTYLQDKSIKDKIVFVTYQSSQLVGIALNELNIKADLGIFDEAHKTATANIESKFAFALKDENVPITKRLFMTATPRHIKFNSDEDEDIEVFSMDNQELYGDIAYEYPMREAINDRIITDYKIVGILIDDKYIDSYTNKVKPYSEDVINEAKIKAINEAMNKYGLNKALIFNRDIAASKELEKYSNTSIFNKTIKHLDGSSKHSYREEVLQELKDNEQYVITNAKLFTEGVDLPIIDMIALFRNVKSEIDIIQTVGRVQRIDKNNPNKIGYILLPIFISNLENIDEEIKSNKDLQYVYEIINSLKENDELLKTTFSYKKQNKSKSNKEDNAESKVKNPNFEIDYMINDADVSDEYVRQVNEKITHRIETVVLKTKWKWLKDSEWKKLFIEFNKEVGFVNLKRDTIYNEEHIGSKLNTIKTYYNKCSPEQQKKLREYWDCFPDEFWKIGKKNQMTQEEWKNLILNAKIETNIILTKKKRIKSDFINSTPEQQKELRAYWDCFPDEFWKIKKEVMPKEEWRDLFINFFLEYGTCYINENTIYKNKKIGQKYKLIRNEFIYADSLKQVKLKEFWDCFPDEFWKIEKKNQMTQEEWKTIFKEFDKEYGIATINSRTIYKSFNLGQKLFGDIKKHYKKSTFEKQKKMREFWDCFPDEIWN